MSNKKPKKKSGGSPLPIIIVILIAGGIAASNFVGPAKGWMTGQKQNSETTTQNTDPESETDDKEKTSEDLPSKTDKEISPEKKTDVPDKEPTGDSNKSMTEFEKKHKEFFEEYMTKAKKPTIGKRYPVVTSSGSVRDGLLDKVDEYSIYLSDIKPYKAKSSIHYSSLRKDMARYFFPEKAANTYANKKLEKYLEEKSVIATIDEEMGTGEDASKTASTGKKSYSASFKEYDPTVAESSPRLAHAAMEVNNYLKNQVRITKKRDNFVIAEVEKCHAKQQGSSAVFYMYVTPQFAAQNTEYKFQVVDGLRRFWALRCMSNGVAGDSRAFLCIVNNGKAIGGSSLKSAEDIQIK